VKTVTFIRHGNANNTVLGFKDFDRTLSNVGIEEATKVAAKIFAMQIPIDIFICSAAKRTMQTCEIFARHYNYSFDNILSNEELYNADYKDVLLLLQALPNEVNSIALIGHNPTMSECATILRNDNTMVDMPTAGCISFEYETENWKDLLMSASKVVQFSTPKI
jgi:phosphohistidine phosphatase